MKKAKLKGSNDMRLKEILELLVLKEWSRDDLAHKLGVSRNYIDRWFCKQEEQRRHPNDEHHSKMREWLIEAREQSRSLLT